MNCEWKQLNMFILKFDFYLSLKNSAVLHFRRNYIKCGRYIRTAWTINARIPAESSDFCIAFGTMQFSVFFIKHSGHPLHWFQKEKLNTRRFRFQWSRGVVKNGFVIDQHTCVGIVGAEWFVSTNTWGVWQNVALSGQYATTWSTMIFNRFGFDSRNHDWIWFE